MKPILTIRRVITAYKNLETIDKQREKLKRLHRSELEHRQKVLDAISDVRTQLEVRWCKAERKNWARDNQYLRGKVRGLKEAYDLLEKYLDNNGY